MLEPTYPLSEEEWQEVRTFENKIKKEFEEYWETVKILSAEDVLKKYRKLEFMTKMTKYFLADNFSLNKIRELTYEYKLLENCYKQSLKYKKEYGGKAESWREYVRMAVEDEDY